MSHRLINDGYQMAVYNRSKSQRFEELVDRGAVACSSPAEVAEQSDIVFTMVGTPADVKQVVAGPEGTLAGLAVGGMTVDMTTSCPTLARELAVVAAECGRISIDAPVTGGDVGARNGTLSVMLGGDRGGCCTLEPVLSSVAASTTYFGDAGMGQHAKLANQIGIASQVVAMAESMVFAHKAGLDLETWLPAVVSGGAGSFSMSNYAPRVLRRDFEPGFYVEHFIKDMDLALQQCKKLGLSLPGLAQCQALFLTLKAQGHSGRGIHALVLALESMNAVELPASAHDWALPTKPEPQVKQAPARRAVNLSAGPSTLALGAMQTAQANFVDHEGSGMGLMEMSHRNPGGKVQTAIADATQSVRDLLAVPDNYHVLWMQGGAHGQFAATLLNCLGGKRQVDLVKTGYWSERFATTEASRMCDINVAWDGACVDYSTVGAPEEWAYSQDSAFIHMCANETIHGVEYLQDPTLPADAPWISCDATSTLLSRRMDISKYGIVYASAGKNLGPAGTTCVIVRDDLLGNAADVCPSVLNYTKQVASVPISSLYNTPPTYNIYMASLVLKEYEKMGGLETIEANAARRAGLIYDIIDRSGGLYTNQVNPVARSRMSMPFRVLGGSGELEDKFIAAGKAQGITELFAHPLFPGLRITAYNGLTDDAVDQVATLMESFLHDHRHLVHTDGEYDGHSPEVAAY